MTESDRRTLTDTGNRLFRDGATHAQVAANLGQLARDLGYSAADGEAIADSL